MVQLPPVPHVSKVNLVWRVHDRQCRNTLHYRNANLGSPPVASDIGPRIVALVGAGIKGALFNGVWLDAIEAIQLSDVNLPVTTYTTGLPVAMTGTGTMLPNSAAAVVSLRTGLRGKSYRGRAYQPGVIANGSDNNTIAGSAQAAIQAFWQSLVTLDPPGGTGDSYHLVIVSYWANKVLRADPVVTDVTTAICRGEWGTQRRRMP